jgi:hypothetical protein
MTMSGISFRMRIVKGSPYIQQNTFHLSVGMFASDFSQFASIDKFLYCCNHLV